jgi:hypothetical protein
VPCITLRVHIVAPLAFHLRSTRSQDSNRRVCFNESKVAVVETVTANANRPRPIDLANIAHGHVRHPRVSAKKAKSPGALPKLKSPKSPKSPGPRNATLALLMDLLELPAPVGKSAKRAEIERMRQVAVMPSRSCARSTMAAQRTPKLLAHARGPRPVH